MEIYELETKNGRTFRVAIANNSQMKRLNKVISDNKNGKSYEKFIRVDCIKNGIHSIKDFEKLSDSLQ